MIAFYDGLTYELDYTVTEVDGKLIVDGDPEKVIENVDAERFMRTFTNFNNGYVIAITLEDGSTPAQSLGDPNARGKAWTPEEIMKAQKKSNNASEK